MTAKKRILLFVLMMTLSTSCASRRQISQNREKHVDAESINKEIEILVQKGNYTEAIEVIAKVDQRPVSENIYSEQFICALNGLAEKGMNYYEAGDYRRAGNTLAFVIGHMPDRGMTTNGLRYSSDQIRSCIKNCEDRMMQRGLIDYRKGNLSDAITIWKEILKLNPDHTEAKQALRTATVQLKNLKKIESD